MHQTPEELPHRTTSLMCMAAMLFSGLVFVKENIDYGQHICRIPHEHDPTPPCQLILSAVEGFFNNKPFSPLQNNFTKPQDTKIKHARIHTEQLFLI